MFNSTQGGLSSAEVLPLRPQLLKASTGSLSTSLGLLHATQGRGFGGICLFPDAWSSLGEGSCLPQAQSWRTVCGVANPGTLCDFLVAGVQRSLTTLACSERASIYLHHNHFS